MTDIVERLRQDWFGTEGLTGREAEMVDTMTEAADTIERLRSLCGKADVGQSFAEITKDLPRRLAEPTLRG